MTTPLEIASEREPAPPFTSADRAAVYAAQSAINGLGQVVEQIIKAQGLLSARFWLIACEEETIRIHTVSDIAGPDYREVCGKVTLMAPRCSHISIDLSFTYDPETKRTAYHAHCRTAEGHHWTMFEPTSVAINRVVQWLMVRGIREGIEKTGIPMTLAGSSDAPVPNVRVEDLGTIFSADLGGIYGADGFAFGQWVQVNLVKLASLPNCSPPEVSGFKPVRKRKAHTPKATK